MLAAASYDLVLTLSKILMRHVASLQRKLNSHKVHSIFARHNPVQTLSFALSWVPMSNPIASVAFSWPYFSSCKATLGLFIA